jgi:hypothetical protein
MNPSQLRDVDSITEIVSMNSSILQCGAVSQTQQLSGGEYDFPFPRI